jgi:hypothetical protein
MTTYSKDCFTSDSLARTEFLGRFYTDFELSRLYLFLRNRDDRCLHPFEMAVSLISSCYQKHPRMALIS